MNTVEGIGYLAASLVLATFCMKSMNALRLAAIASNMAFIAYGYFGHLAPVLLLHALLLPINIYRLVEPVSPDASKCPKRVTCSGGKECSPFGNFPKRPRTRR
jgi:hypothetical protein